MACYFSASALVRKTSQTELRAQTVATIPIKANELWQAVLAGVKLEGLEPIFNSADDQEIKSFILSLAKKRPWTLDDYKMLQASLGILAYRAPELTIQLLRDDLAPDFALPALSLALSRLTETNPQRAIALLKDLRSDEQVKTARIAVADELFKVGLHSALSMSATATVSDTVALQALLLEKAGGTDPANAMKEAFELIDKEKRIGPYEDYGTRIMDPIMSAWLKTSPSAALTWVAENGTKISLNMQMKVVEALVERFRQPMGQNLAMEIISKMPNGFIRSSVFSSIFQEMAKRSPEDALRVANQLPNSLEATKAQTLIYSEMMRSNPDEALKLAAELPGPAQRNLVAERYILESAQTDPVKTASLINGIKDATMQNRMGLELVVAWTQKDPIQAAQYVLHNMPKSGDKRKYLGMYFSLLEDKLEKGGISNSTLSGAGGISPQNRTALLEAAKTYEIEFHDQLNRLFNRE